MMTIDGNEWQLDDLRTIEDCNEAEDFLLEAIVKIEAQLMAPRGPDWERKARYALQIRKRVLHIVERTRGEMRRAEALERTTTFQNRLIELMKTTHPELFHELVERLAA